VNFMRVVLNTQAKFGYVDIASIPLNHKSRDDIPRILIGLQYIYKNEELRQEIFQILEDLRPNRKESTSTENNTPQKVSSTRGRPGMEQWQILVLGVLRLGLNTDYDRLCELANNHLNVRQFLGHGLIEKDSPWDENKVYHLQTIKDNIEHFTEEIFERINQAVVKAGHKLVKNKPKRWANSPE
jgi:transposase, IS5 family